MQPVETERLKNLFEKNGQRLIASGIACTHKAHGLHCSKPMAFVDCEEDSRGVWLSAECPEGHRVFHRSPFQP